MINPDGAQIALLNWYATHGRTLPWRSDAPDPYTVMLSEFMLQQTTVAAVKPYFADFMSKWPSVTALASARDEDVMAAWAGLGYYARARNLLKAARAIVAQGGFPKDSRGLERLPGIGPYTAAAIAAIAFGEEILPLDGNIKRILARLYCLNEEIDKTGPELRALAEAWAHARPGDLAQAMMDLGAMICRAKSPKCEICPVATHCQAYQQNQVQDYPKRTAKRAKKLWRAHGFILETPNGIGFLRREETGLLGGLWALPSSEWGAAPEFAPPTEGKWQSLGEIRHVFTHIDLRMEIWYQARDLPISSNELQFMSEDTLPRSALPALWRKAVSKMEEKHG